MSQRRVQVMCAAEVGFLFWPKPTLFSSLPPQKNGERPMEDFPGSFFTYLANTVDQRFASISFTSAGKNANLCCHMCFYL